MTEPGMWPSGVDGWPNFSAFPNMGASSIPSAAVPQNSDLVKLEKSENSEYGDGSYGPPPPGEFPAEMQPFYNQMYPGMAPGSMPQATHQMMPPAQDEQVKQQKDAFYAHPLYPLLSCLFEKCELATSTPRDCTKDGASTSNDVCSANSFQEDVNEFAKLVQTEKPFYAPNPELDALMLNAIQMLRFHLLELEKVHELCDNFCNRYVTCLKGKMPMDIVGEEGRASGSQLAMSPGSTPHEASPMNQNMGHYPTYEPQTVPLPENTSAMTHPMEGSSMGYPQGPHPSQQTAHPTQPGPQATHPTHPAQDHPLAMGGPPPTTAGAPHSQSQQAVSSPSASSSTGTQNESNRDNSCLSNNGNPASNDSQSEAGDELSSLCGSNDDGRESVLSDGTNGKRKVPKVFSKEAITKFRAWLFQNLSHPYPSEEQKKQLASDTGLTILQVNNWFINARRRIVQPMIDQSNRAGRQPAVNVFKNRKKGSEMSPGESPDLNPSSYSPEALVPPPIPYSTPDFYGMQRNMFSTPNYGAFPPPVMPFMNSMMGFNPASQMMNTSWMDPSSVLSGTQGTD